MRTSRTRSHAEAIQRLLPARRGSGAACRPAITPADRAALIAQIPAPRAERATEVPGDVAGRGEAERAA